VPPPAARARASTPGWAVGGGLAAIVVASPCGATAARRGRRCLARTRAEAEARFTAEAARIAGPGAVRCDDGYAFTGAGATRSASRSRGRGSPISTRPICRGCYDLAFARTRSDERTVDSIVVLAHEAVHLGGERREGVTECLALQAAGPLACDSG
jgi:hypothetical protein